jgi:hypothetical protein
VGTIVNCRIVTHENGKTFLSRLRQHTRIVRTPSRLTIMRLKPSLSTTATFLSIYIAIKGTDVEATEIKKGFKQQPTSHRSTLGSKYASPMNSASLPRRVACGLYLWDAPSALLHKWCHHLIRDCVFEGRGGKKVSRRMTASCKCQSRNSPPLLPFTSDVLTYEYVNWE